MFVQDGIYLLEFVSLLGVASMKETVSFRRLWMYRNFFLRRSHVSKGGFFSLHEVLILQNLMSLQKAMS